ncbi:MAG: lysophospholipid acyltransferase family protein [Pricia sp.]
MKNLAYRLLKLWIKSGLHLYYGRIKISGLENVPKDKPVLFLPNHQGALMDVLLIVTDCRRKPYFLTRSDVFKNPTLERFFTFLQMLPIYRIRDGRDSLGKNQAVFERCTRLFRKNQAIVMFPEGNHNRERRVRPLSKGFTRILFKALNQAPNQEIYVVPVGLNYLKNDGFPDKVTLNYGQSIQVNGLYDPNDKKSSVDRLKGIVSKHLQALTTHVGDGADYGTMIQKLDALEVNYLNPLETNAAIKAIRLRQGNRKEPSETSLKSAPIKGVGGVVLKAIFILLNFPVLVLWNLWVKPKVWEPEFTATLRFGFALLFYPIYYVALFVILAVFWSTIPSLFVIIGIFLLNRIYVSRG